MGNMSALSALVAGGVLSALAYNEMPFYDTLPAWTLNWTDATHGTIATDAAHGGWKIHVARDDSRYGGYSLTIYNPDKNRAVIEGSGYLDLRGTITGPCFANSATNAVYKIGAMDADCLRANNGSSVGTPAATVTGLFTPGTMTGAGFKEVFHNDGSPKSLVRDVYVVEPSITSLPNWLFSGCTSLNYVLFKTPSVTTMNGPLCNCRSPQAPSSFSEWDFTSVTQAGANNSSGVMGAWGAVRGTLTLPALQTIVGESAFRDCNMGDVLLGLRGALENVCSNAFGKCNSLTNVVLGAQPKGKTLEIGCNAFAGTSLKSVWFNGENPPTFKKAPNTFGFGTETTPEGAITFYVRETPGWAAILAEADANGGLVAASRFNTKNRQRVARFGGFLYVAEDGGIPIFDSRFAEKFNEQVEVVPADFPYTANGLLAFPVTLSASCSTEADEKGRRAHFHRWDGASVEQERQTTCTLNAPGEFGAIRPMFVHDWFYDAAAGTIENGIWTINVTVVSSDARTLRIGSTAGTSVNGGTRSTAFKGPGYGEGILDFNGDIRDAEGNAWTITATSRYCMTKLENAPSQAEFKTSDFPYLPTVVVFPETLTTLDGNEFNFNNTRPWPLEEVIFIAPSCTSPLHWVVNGSSLLTRLLIRAPKVKIVNANAIWQNATLDGTDCSTWDLSSVTNVEKDAFLCSTGMRGVLSLPSLQTIGSNNFRKHGKLEGVVLATNLTLTAVGTNAFNSCAALKSVVVGNAAVCTIGEASFAGTTKPARVTFLGGCNREAADQILAGTDATDGAKTATLYASAAFKWDQSVAAPTAAEAAVMPAGVQGVYRDGLRKAWFVNAKSPFDPNGTILILR